MSFANNYNAISMINPNYALGSFAYQCQPPVENSQTCQLLKSRHPTGIALAVPLSHKVCPRDKYPTLLDLFGH